MNITIRDYRDDNAQAFCPSCQELVKCGMVGYLKGCGMHKIEFHHSTCGTDWEYDLILGETTILNKQKAHLEDKAPTENPR
jgi:hypothetical protein